MIAGLLLATTARAAGSAPASRPATAPATVPAAREPTPEEWRKVDEDTDALLRRRAHLHEYVPRLAAWRGEKSEAVAARRAELASVERSIEVRAGDLAERFTLDAGRKVPRDPAALPPLLGDLRDAKRVVFVFDARWVTINRMSSLRPLLKAGVRSLADGRQAFEVVHFGGGGEQKRPAVWSMNPGGPVPATARSKEALWAAADDVSPDGTADPTEALRHALARKPDAVVLVMTVDFDAEGHRDRLVTEAARLTAGTNVRIHTLAVATELKPDARYALRRIARATGGTSRSLTSDEFPDAVAEFERRR